VRFLDLFAEALYTSRSTPALVRAYAEWVRRFIFFHNKRHPQELGETEVRAYLSYLSNPEAGSTLFQQAEAARALHFLDTVFLQRPSSEVALPAGLPDPPAASPGQAPRAVTPAGPAQRRVRLSGVLVIAATTICSAPAHARPCPWKTGADVE
jgi:hypothetical protein